MTDSPSVDREAPAPWWEGTPDGTEIPVALVRVDREASSQHQATGDALRTEARFMAGVEYIARAFGAAEPLVWDVEGVTLILGGVPAESLPERAYLAARELWERARIDLDLPVRVGAHVGHVRFRTDPREIHAEDVALCRQLAAVAPPRSVALSEDVVLALRESSRVDLALLGVVARHGVPAWVFPAGAAVQKDPAMFLERGDEALWDAFRRYSLGRDVRDLRYVGFRLVKKEPPVLDIRDVFMPPEVALRPRREAAEERPRGRARAASPHRDAEPTGPIAVRDLLARHRSTILLGDPGSGKTTLIRWLAVTAAGGRFVLGSQAGISERLLPLPISVGRLAEVRRAMPDASVPAVLARYFHDRGLGDEPALKAFLERTLSAGHGLVLLDGLDEVRAGERDTIHAWLAAFAAAHRKNRFVATSRIVGYVGFPLPEAAEAILRPFDDAQVERYVRTFVPAYTRWELGGDDEGNGKIQADELLGSLRANGRLLALARNPFMLSALALVHRAEGRLPRHRVQAYAIFARALCETWAEARRLIAGEPAGASIAYEEEALPILGQLAFAMHQRYPTGVAPEAFVVETLAKALSDRQGVSGDDAQRAARAFLARAGHEVQILMERGAGEWGFLHLTFQEFFTAAGLHALERFDEEAFRHLFDPRWEEVLRLGVGYLALEQKRPEAARRFVQKVLDYEAPEPERWVTSVLKKQVPLAALLAAEAGDALPEGLKKRVAEAMADWVCDPPDRWHTDAVVQEIAQYDFKATLAESLLTSIRHRPPPHKHRFGALTNLAPEVAIGDVLSTASRVPYEDCEAMAGLLSLVAPEPADLTLSLLHESSPKLRTLAVFMLARTSLDLASEALFDETEEVRKTAARRLWRASHESAALFSGQMIRVMSDATKDKCDDVRARVVEALGRVARNHKGAEDSLLRLYGSEANVGVRVQIAEALCRMHSSAALTLLRDQSEEVRLGVAEYAYLLEPESTYEHLLAMLTDASPQARAGAAAALAHFNKLKRTRAALLRAIKDPCPEVRAGAVVGILSGGVTGKVPALPTIKIRGAVLSALQDPDWQVRKAALYMVGNQEWPWVLDQILEAATSAKPQIRCAALFALTYREVDAEEIEGVFITAMFDNDDAVREAAVSALGVSALWGSCSTAAFEALLRALSDSERSVRAGAASALGEWDAPAAVPHLLRALPTTPAAREALWKIAERLHAPDPPTDA